ncbi:hypothetical protein HMPREF3291_24495 [Bacillus sp. HMSC76G11]|nr:hypothetical protein HMPREF3291_24495 [Bacillus sp. HMSC76G11]
MLRSTETVLLLRKQENRPRAFLVIFRGFLPLEITRAVFPSAEMVYNKKMRLSHGKTDFRYEKVKTNEQHMVTA